MDEDGLSPEPNPALCCRHERVQGPQPDIELTSDPPTQGSRGTPPPGRSPGYATGSPPSIAGPCSWLAVQKRPSFHKTPGEIYRTVVAGP